MFKSNFHTHAVQSVFNFISVKSKFDFIKKPLDKSRKTWYNITYVKSSSSTKVITNNKFP